MVARATTVFIVGAALLGEGGNYGVMTCIIPLIVFMMSNVLALGRCGQY